MTITILVRATGQNIPRPYNRADNVEEMVELLDRHIKTEARRTGLTVERLVEIAKANLDTESPVLQLNVGHTTFYAFHDFASLLL